MHFSSILTPKVLSAIFEPILWVAWRRGYGKHIVLSKVKSIIIFRCDEIGDVVLTTPLLREIRRNAPDAWITLVVKPSIKNLVEMCPYVNEVLVYDWVALLPDNWRCSSEMLNRFKRMVKFCRWFLWRKKFDLAVLPRWAADYYDSTYLAYLCGARHRIGHSQSVNIKKATLNGGFDYLLTEVVSDTSAKHQVEHNLDILRHLGGEVGSSRLEAWLTTEDEMFAQTRVGRNGQNRADIVVGLGLGAGWEYKVWPAEYFCEISRWLAGTIGAKVVLLGGVADIPTGRAIVGAIGNAAINVVGQTTLRQTAAILKHCDVFVGNDSGPMHLASIFNLPIIAIFSEARRSDIGPDYAPAWFRPWHAPHTVIQPDMPLPPCSDGCSDLKSHCIRQIKPEIVIKSLEKFIEGVKGRTGQQ